MSNFVHILEPGFLTTVQDLGRAGYERFGVPVSGAMDRFALLAANWLVGNPPGAAGLEFTLQGPALWLEQDGLVAAAGGGFSLRIDGRPIPLWMAAWARAGEVIELRPGAAGVWGCLALAGGLALEPVLGSRATYLRGGLGGLQGRALQAGDALPVGGINAHSINQGAGPQWSEGQLYNRAGLSLPPARRPAYAAAPTLEVVLAEPPQAPGGAFTPAGLSSFLESAYTLTPACDRMGYRLSGPPIAHAAKADILSEGIPLGTVQVPGDGQPIVLLADRQATGGYTKIATLGAASLPLLVQCPPGAALRFRAVSVQTAQSRWRALAGGLK